jgi:hypothetical protein
MPTGRPFKEIEKLAVRKVTSGGVTGDTCLQRPITGLVNPEVYFAFDLNLPSRVEALSCVQQRINVWVKVSSHRFPCRSG